MSPAQVEEYLNRKYEFFAPEHTDMIRNRLEKVQNGTGLETLAYQNPNVILLVSIWVGFWGVDRFMLKDIGLGVLKLITGGGFFIWWIVDMINAIKNAQEKNFTLLLTESEKNM